MKTRYVKMNRAGNYKNSTKERCGLIVTDVPDDVTQADLSRLILETQYIRDKTISFDFLGFSFKDLYDM